MTTTKTFMMTISDEMYTELDIERKARKVETIQEAVRMIISDYLRNKER